MPNYLFRVRGFQFLSANIYLELILYSESDKTFSGKYKNISMKITEWTAIVKLTFLTFLDIFGQKHES